MTDPFVLIVVALITLFGTVCFVGWWNCRRQCHEMENEIINHEWAYDQMRRQIRLLEEDVRNGVAIIEGLRATIWSKPAINVQAVPFTPEDRAAISRSLKLGPAAAQSESGVDLD